MQRKILTPCNRRSTPEMDALYFEFGWYLLLCAKDVILDPTSDLDVVSAYHVLLCCIAPLKEGLPRSANAGESSACDTSHSLPSYILRVDSAFRWSTTGRNRYYTWLMLEAWIAPERSHQFVPKHPAAVAVWNDKGWHLGDGSQKRRGGG